MQNPLDVFVQYYSKMGPVVLLESQSDDHPASTHSYLAACPLATIKAWGNSIEIKEGSDVSAFQDDPWAALRSFRESWDDWLFGYLSYDLKNYTEKLDSNNDDALGAPDLFFMVPGVLLKLNATHNNPRWIKGRKPESFPKYKNVADPTIQNLHSNVSKEEYLTIIDRAKKEIYEGTYYEINLSHQLRGQFRGSAHKLYQQMRNVGPVPFGSFLQFDGYSICSLSPERFLRKEGRTVFSQPIKGTMKRDQEINRDEKLRKKLVKSTKNRAENLMIVDLVRNDLSRIAKEGSVEVTTLFEIQTFGTVHQMVSTIKAQAAIDDPVEIIKACYPMGSMTGAPKISAMQSIEELENYRRGIYSGAIGYIAPNGDFDFNVVIRTAIIKNNLLCYAVGGAITGDSDPDDEWAETWLKAKALIDSTKKSVRG
jgi:para-aminobenzoate synthetase component 1